MKTVIISCVLVFLLIITSLILFTVYGQNTRQNELEDSLSIAVEQSLENLKINKSYSVNNTEEFIADFLENLLISIESDSDIKVEILSVDVEKGLLDVNVIETFSQPNGSTKSISCRKTVILEEYSQAAPNYYFVRFMTTNEGNDVDFVDYKVYSICEDSLLIVPSTKPTKKNHEFVGWSTEKPTEENEYSPETVKIEDINGKLKVKENLTYYAVFKENT